MNSTTMNCATSSDLIYVYLESMKESETYKNLKK